MIYIAAPFFDKKQLDTVVQIENILGENCISYYSPRSEGVLTSLVESERQKIKGDLYNSNIKHMYESTLAIAVIDGRDTGTIFEMGFMAALNIPIISVSNEGHGINVMLAESVRCHVSSMGDLLEAIENPNYKSDPISGIF